MSPYTPTTTTARNDQSSLHSLITKEQEVVRGALDTLEQAVASQRPRSAVEQALQQACHALSVVYGLVDYGIDESCQRGDVSAEEAAQQHRVVLDRYTHEIHLLGKRILEEIALQESSQSHAAASTK